jgi:hypothetical protein
MRTFADSILQIPQPWPSDPVSVTALSQLHMMGLGISGGFGGSAPDADRDRADRFLARFFTGARINGLREASLKQVSTLYWTFGLALASSFTERLSESDRYREWERRVRSEVPDLSALRADLAALRAQHLEILRSRFTPFAVRLAEALTGLGLEDSPEGRLRARFLEALESLPEAERARAEEVAQAWREAGARAGGPDTMFEELVQVAQEATCEVELAAVLNLLDLFSRAMDVVSGADTDPKTIEAARRLRAIRRSIQARVQGRVFEQPVRDWRAWREGRLPAAAAGAAPEEGSSLPLPLVAVFAALLLLGLLSLLARRGR